MNGDETHCPPPIAESGLSALHHAPGCLLDVSIQLQGSPSGTCCLRRERLRSDPLSLLFRPLGVRGPQHPWLKTLPIAVDSFCVREPPAGPRGAVRLHLPARGPLACCLPAPPSPRLQLHSVSRLHRVSVVLRALFFFFKTVLAIPVPLHLRVHFLDNLRCKMHLQKASSRVKPASVWGEQTPVRREVFRSVSTVCLSIRSFCFLRLVSSSLGSFQPTSPARVLLQLGLGIF